MNFVTRRNAIRASGLAMMAPFIGAGTSSFGQNPSAVPSQSPQSNTSVLTPNSDLLNYAADGAAHGVALAHSGQRPDYAAISAHCRAVARHIDELGLDPLIKHHSSDMLSSSSYPRIDSQWQNEAVSRVQKYDPSFTANDLMSKIPYPATSAEWVSALTSLKNRGFVAHCHDAADQLSYMATVSNNPASPAAAVAYERLRQSNGVHVLDVACLVKFFACIAAVVVVGTAVIAVVLVACAGIAIAACAGGGTLAAAYAAAFGLAVAAALAGCTAFLASGEAPRNLLEMAEV
jgi:hypothetical protein